MLDPIVNFFTRVFQWIGRGIGFVIGIILWPFLWAGRWYTERGWILKSVIGLIVAGIVVLTLAYVVMLVLRNRAAAPKAEAKS